MHEVKFSSKLVIVLLLVLMLFVALGLRIINFKRPLGTYRNPMAEYFAYS